MHSVSVQTDQSTTAKLEAAIVQAVAYVDLFDYPLTAAEVHRYLEGIPASLETVEKLLANGRLLPHRLSRQQQYYTLPGREAIVQTRQRREQAAQSLWPVAARYGRLIAALPFVKMVAVTGSLAVNNADRHADIDYMIVTAHGRVWLTRALTILIVKWAARRHFVLCPNYILSERALPLKEQSLYIARELAQMIPLYGLEIYQEMRQQNGWTAAFFPNATTMPHRPTFAPIATAHKRPLRTLCEWLLGGKLGTRLEKWEMQRKVRKFGQHQSPFVREVAFSADWCKGHFDGHAQRIMAHYRQRLQQIEKEEFS